MPLASRKRSKAAPWMYIIDLTKISTSDLCTAPAVLAATWINEAIRVESPQPLFGRLVASGQADPNRFFTAKSRRQCDGGPAIAETSGSDLILSVWHPMHACGVGFRTTSVAARIRAT